MNKYGRAAVDAAILCSRDKELSPRDAWNEATIRIFGVGTSAQRKDCPRDAFLGLCEEGLVKGIPAGKYCNSIMNKGYALSAVAVLRRESSLSDQPRRLWKWVMEGKGTAHNNQMDVVTGLWNSGLISKENQ